MMMSKRFDTCEKLERKARQSRVLAFTCHTTMRVKFPVHSLR